MPTPNPHDEQHEEVALLRERVQRLEQMQERLVHLIWGNGSAGLRDDVTEIKRWMQGMRKWLSLIAGTLIVQLIGISLAFLWLLITKVAVHP